MQKSNQTEAHAPVIWLNTLVFGITFLIAVIGVPLYGLTHGFSGGLWLAFVLTIGFAGISITAGYHRLWSHKTYQANPVLRFLFAIGGALALQNSILHWSSDHREHHKHVDHDDHDPYSASRGFWYSHIGWMLREYQQHRYTNYDNVKDLQQDPIVMWQHRNYLTLTLLTNFGWPILLGVLMGDILGAMLLIGFLRLVVNHHTTFFINSLAHMWGRQPYTDRNSARDNGWLAFLTFGEGYHNYHHIFSADYRNGIRWWQFDPTKWLIKGCSWFGLTWGLKKCSEYQVEKARLDMQFQRLQVAASSKPQHTMEKLHEEYEQLLLKLKEYYLARKKLLDTRAKALRDQMHLPTLEQLQQQVRDLKHAFKAQRRDFRELLESYQRTLTS
ncbi:Delta-9 acyl-phospholipid desaturase [Pseudidiomarina planktonica]|uniref:Delta-9 acyl-phospholipid desaturase n=1 Tax=Pseudidiomarina planktonica TaxID=1323738 RepID=A0A1Y6EBD7_9GAMM|nr:fatty acid desaturase [Pseudidiomarina planktonica]RUO66183.1 acyl-CoA desaturase [Pseudidiomarina planktonica]SMQ59855.1 Delta-9 acyl-phospholipid desaturase [Pseudidiomarina planktonica]